MRVTFWKQLAPLALFFTSTAVLVVGDSDVKVFEDCDAPDGKVCLTISTESLDPCSPQWIFDFQNNVLPAVGDILQVRRYLDGTAKPAGESCLFEQPMDFHVCTFHGDVEREVHYYEGCVQYFAAQLGLEDRGHRASLEYTYCTNGNCTGPGTGCFGLNFCEYTGTLLTPEGLVRSRDCVKAIDPALVWQDISECAVGIQGRNLHWESSRYINEIGLTFGAVGLPPVLLNGEAFSCFFDCNSHATQLQPLIDKICELYNGDTPPAACTQQASESATATGNNNVVSRMIHSTQNIIARMATAAGFN